MVGVIMDETYIVDPKETVIFQTEITMTAISAGPDIFKVQYEIRKKEFNS